MKIQGGGGGGAADIYGLMYSTAFYNDKCLQTKTENSVVEENFE